MMRTERDPVNAPGPVLCLPDFLRAGARGRESGTALLEKGDTGWRTISYRELWDRIDRLAAGLRALGIRPGDRVALLMRNRPEWIISDLAILSIGAADVPLYATLTPAQMGGIMADAGCVAAMVEGGLNEERIIAAAPALRWLIGVHGRPGLLSEAQSLSLAELDALRQSTNVPQATPATAPASHEDLATIIYTSGTTGTPKGVMLTHGNFVANIRSVHGALPLGPDDVFLSFLPLSHVFERTGGHYVPLSLGATIAYAESPETVATSMGEIRPTVIPAVPRFFEKMRDRVLAAAENARPVRRALMRWAFRTALPHAGIMREGDPPAPRAVAHRVADALVFRKLRSRLGGRVRFFFSGGAALSSEVENFFWAAGIPILQGYGLTETSPVTNVNRPGASRAGTVGPPIPGVEIRIAADGEILIRGDNVMKGYWNRPEDTARAIDSEGWFHTGDIGRVSDDGYLSITDRKKDIIVLATGKNVAPQDVEPVITRSAWIAQVLVVGEGRSWLAALVAPDFARLTAEFPDLPASDAAREEALASSPEIARFLGRELARAQEGLAPYQRVRRFRLLGREFSSEEDEVTPTLKLKRASIVRRRAEQIEGLFRNAPGTWPVPSAESDGEIAGTGGDR